MTFLIYIDFFNLLINFFDFLIDFDQSFYWKEIENDWLYSKLDWNCNRLLEIVVGIRFKLKSSSEFVGIRIWIVDDSICQSASPKLTDTIHLGHAWSSVVLCCNTSNFARQVRKALGHFIPGRLIAEPRSLLFPELQRWRMAMNRV